MAGYSLKGFTILNSFTYYSFCDNGVTIDIAFNPEHHSKTKHIELDYHFIREKVQAHCITPTRIYTKLQLADIFTKPLGKVPH